MRLVYRLFVVLLVLGFSTGTLLRNRTWATEKSLWEDAAIKAPRSARPLTSLAWDMAYGENAHPRNYDNALVLYKKSLDLYHVRRGMKPSILNNMAGLYYEKKDYRDGHRPAERILTSKSIRLKSTF